MKLAAFCQQIGPFLLRDAAKRRFSALYGSAPPQPQRRAPAANLWTLWLRTIGMVLDGILRRCGRADRKQHFLLGHCGLGSDRSLRYFAHIVHRG